MKRNVLPPTHHRLLMAFWNITRICLWNYQEWEMGGVGVAGCPHVWSYTYSLFKPIPWNGFPALSMAYMLTSTNVLWEDKAIRHLKCSRSDNSASAHSLCQWEPRKNNTMANPLSMLLHHVDTSLHGNLVPPRQQMKTSIQLRKVLQIFSQVSPTWTSPGV